MSSIILAKLGSMAGNAIGGPVGGAIGHGLGEVIGHEIDQNLFFRKKHQVRVGPRLLELNLQTASYGKMIPIVYGTARIAGNIIWASEIKERREDHYQRLSKFASKSLVASQYHYSISLAIAICEGEAQEILRVWLDDKMIDPKQANYRFYSGSENQKPDPLIEAIERKTW